MKRSLTIKLFLFLNFFLISGLLTAADFDQFPGVIPLEFKRPPATDLVYKGRVLLPAEARQLQAAGEVKLEDLNPQESDLWRNQYHRDSTEESENIAIESNDSVKYVSNISSRSGNFRFSVIKETDEGDKTYILMVNKKIHNILLRKALLEKIGYYVPPIKYISKITLTFDNKFAVENFINSLSEATFGAPARWVVSKDLEGHTVNLQDVIALENDHHVYNLALGYVPSYIIKGRRVLNSLLIPFSLLMVPESLNLFSWRAGRVVNKHVSLNYDSSEEFSTPLEDALWSIKRVIKLTRSDFAEIAKKASLPSEVEALLIEKLISRRNNIAELFKLSIPEIDFNAKISQGEYLEDGKLKKENWEGYASRFAFGDPDSPLSSSEIFAFFKSKFISNIISNLVQKFNTNLMPTTDIGKELMAKRVKHAQDNFLKYITTGKISDSALGTWMIPTIGTNFLASRNIVTGSYLGTDNIIQLADTIAVSVDAGAYLGTDRVTPPFALSGSIKGSFTRRYTHLTPIKSMKKALKTPFRNILVPWLKRKYGNILDGLTADDLNSLADDERKKRLMEVMGLFKEELAIGESIIISDQVGAKLGINVGYKMTDLIKAQASLLNNSFVLSRLHIHRKNENTIQIYKDLGGANSFGASFTLKAAIPIIRITAFKMKGKARTKFYSLNIDENEKRNPDLVKNIHALRQLLLKNSLEEVETIKKPYVLKHKFSDTTVKIPFLFWRWRSKKISDFITVTHPNGFTKKFFRSVKSKRKGKDYIALGVDVLNSLISENYDTDIAISNSFSDNPGNTYKGSAVTRTVTLEGEITKENEEESLRDIFTSINYEWKGWKIKSKKLKKILDQINSKYNFQFYLKEILGQTKELQLYSIKLNIYLYQKALEYMANIDKKSVAKIFRSHAMVEVYQDIDDDLLYDRSEEEKEEEALQALITRFLYFQKKYNKHKAKGNLKKTSSYGIKMTSLIESSLPLAGFYLMVGNKDSIYIHSKISGFRTGDEAGDTPLLSSSMGEIGAVHFKGPLYSIRNKLGMTAPEFYIQWLLGTL